MAALNPKHPYTKVPKGNPFSTDTAQKVLELQIADLLAQRDRVYALKSQIDYGIFRTALNDIARFLPKYRQKLRDLIETAPKTDTPILDHAATRIHTRIAYGTLPAQALSRDIRDIDFDNLPATDTTDTEDGNGECDTTASDNTAPATTQPIDIVSPADLLDFD